MKSLQTLKNRFEIPKTLISKITGGELISGLKNNEDDDDMD